MEKVFRFGELELDESSLELRCGGSPVEIRPKALWMLMHLVRNRWRIVSREELLSELWPGIAVSETSLGTLLYEVRRAIGEPGAESRSIATLRGRGYRFVADVVEVEAPGRAPGSDLEPGSDRSLAASWTSAPFVDREEEMRRLMP